MAIYSASTISIMTGSVSAADQDQCEVSGYNYVADGGGGLFVYVASSSVATDGGSVFASSVGGMSGRWLRVMAGQGGSPGGPAGAVSVKWWGAKGTGGTGDATTNVTAFNAAIAYAYGLLATNGSPGAVYIPSGTYYINGTVSVYGGTGGAVSIYGDGPENTYIIATGSNNFSMFQGLPDGSGSIDRWSFKRMSIDGGGTHSCMGVICLDFYTNTVSGSTSRGVVEEVLFWNAYNGESTIGYGLKVHGYVNSYRDCHAYGCGIGFYLASANACVMEKCYANGNVIPIQVTSGDGLFINAAWESNGGPMLLDGVHGCTLHNCYTEANGPETPTSSLGQSTQIVAGATTSCTNLIIIGGNYGGGSPATSDNQQNQYMFEWVDVDGYSFLNVDTNPYPNRNILRGGSASANPGIMSFNHVNVGTGNAPDASVADHMVNYFPNPNFELGFNPNNANDLGCYAIALVGGGGTFAGVTYPGPAVALYNFNSPGVPVTDTGYPYYTPIAPTYNGSNVRYGLNSLQIVGNGYATAGLYGLSFTLPWYMTTALLGSSSTQGKSVCAVMLVKCVPNPNVSGTNYATNAAVPTISIPSVTGSAVDAYLGDNWILVVSGPFIFTNQYSQIEVIVSGCASGQTMSAGDILYVDSVWLVPSNFSTQQLLAGNVKSLEVAKYQVFRNNPGDPTIGTYVLTPNFIGEEVLDTGSNAWYKAIGTGSGDWQAL